MNDLMKKFNIAELKLVSTPMSTATSLGLDEDGEFVDQREYRSLIGSLLYLTATRADIQFTVYLCACFQASPRSSYRMTVHQIFRYLKHTFEFGILYSASSSLDLIGFLMQILWVVGLIVRALLVLVIFWIFSCLLVFSKTIFSCPIHQRGCVCSRCSQIIWIVHTMRDFRVSFKRVPLMCDNISAISVAKKPNLP
jgi:hypothetical protein